MCRSRSGGFNLPPISPTKSLLALALCALLLGVTATVPTARAHTDVANIFLDTFETESGYRVNMTARFPDGLGLCGAAPTVQLIGKNAGVPPGPLAGGSMTAVGGEAVPLWYRNQTLDVGYDSYSVQVSWSTGISCSTAHVDAQSFRGIVLHTTNANQTVVINNGVGDAGFSTWFNQTFLQNAIFGNATFGNFTTLSNMVVETAFDDYIPIILYGGLVVFFLYLRAWFPAVASLMATGASLMDPPIFNRAASVLLILVALAVHAIAVSGMMPGPWGRRE